MIRLASILALSILSAASAAPQVKLGKTVVTGRSVPEAKQEFFGGIPYAEPPVGDLRFQPTILKSSPGLPTFNASGFGFRCLQSDEPLDTLSEDCLSINIFRPAGLKSDSALPVLVWVHGGGFTNGAGEDFDGTPIVSQSISRGTPIIYVNFNYRLGPLGFPQGKEAQSHGVFNLGLKDQLTALEWVQHNIAVFGGDARKVTVFGESSGAISISILFFSPNFPELARAAILESGSAASTITFVGSRDETDWQNFVSGVPGCASEAKSSNTIQCLATVNSSSLLQGFLFSNDASVEAFPWLPVIDGPGGLLPDFPSRLFDRGEFARIPFISGTNLDEGTLLASQSTNSSQEIHNWLVANYTPSMVGLNKLESAVQEVLEFYSTNPEFGSPFFTGEDTFDAGDQYKRLAAIVNDLVFLSPRKNWMQTASNTGVKTFGYLFADPETTDPPVLGVAHEAELPYVYGTLVNVTASAQTLSVNMIDYWISFATNLDPNDGHGSIRPHWDQYTPQNRVILQLNGTTSALMSDDYRGNETDFWNSDPLLFYH